MKKADLKVTHARWQDVKTGLPTRCDLADGYMVYLLRQELPSHPYWVDERPQPIDTLRQGQFLLLDLRVQHSAVVRGDVDCISIFTGSDTIQRFQLEHNLSDTGLLHAPHGAIHEDHVIRNLGEALLPAIASEADGSDLYVSHVALALLSRLTAKHGIEWRKLAPPRGGLAPWQVRRAKEMLTANLDGGIGLEALAFECRLSRSHFARAFKVSTGMSPLQWLNARRIEKAKGLLLKTDFHLEQIAGLCGFADASHLARSFLRAVGQPPGGWRRVRRY